MAFSVYRINGCGKITVFLLLALDLWAFQEAQLSGPKWQMVLFAVGLPFIIWGVPVVFLSHLEINDTGIAYRLGRLRWKLPSIGWKEIKRIMDDSFLFWHTYRILPSMQIEWFSSKPIILCSNLFTANSQEFLHEVVLRVPPNTLVDQSILEWLGLTPADIGRLYRESRKIGTGSEVLTAP